MAPVAISFLSNQGLDSDSRGGIEIHSRSRFWRGQSQLIKMECRQLGGDLVLFRRHRNVPKTHRGGDRVFVCIVQSLIKKIADAPELENRDQRIPVSSRSPTAGPGVQVDAGHIEGIGDEGCRWSAVRPGSFPVEEKLGIKFTRSPTHENRADLLIGYRWMHNTQQVRHWFEVWSSCDDRPNVQ